MWPIAASMPAHFGMKEKGVVDKPKGDVETDGSVDVVAAMMRLGMTEGITPRAAAELVTAWK